MTAPQSAIRAELDDILAAISVRDSALHYRARDEVPRCGRPTAAGRPCRAVRMKEVSGGTVVVEHRDYLPPSCAAHASAAERAEHDRLVDLTEQRIAECQRAIWAAQRVHCWDWPVTGEHQARLRAIEACQDPEESRELSLRLLRDWQDGRCALCAGPDVGFLDHSHETGMVRGRLCKCCNTQEGFAGTDGVFERYRQRNPASILGLEIRYWSPFTGWAETRLATA